MPNIYDPTQTQGGGLEELLQDPEFLDLLSQMGYLPEATGMPEGRQAGGTFVAAHPLEFMAAAGQNIVRGLKGPKMNRALAEALRQRTGATGYRSSVPSTWGYEASGFGPGGSHEGWT